MAPLGHGCTKCISPPRSGGPSLRARQHEMRKSFGRREGPPNGHGCTVRKSYVHVYLTKRQGAQIVDLPVLIALRACGRMEFRGRICDCRIQRHELCEWLTSCCGQRCVPSIRNESWRANDADEAMEAVSLGTSTRRRARAYRYVRISKPTPAREQSAGLRTRARNAWLSSFPKMSVAGSVHGRAQVPKGRQSPSVTREPLVGTLATRRPRLLRNRQRTKA